MTQDKNENQQLLDEAALLDEHEGIRQGLEDVACRRGSFFAEFEAKNGISR